MLGKYSLSNFKLPGGTYNGHVEEHMGYLQRRKFIVNEFGFWDFGDGRGSADSAFRRNNEFGYLLRDAVSLFGAPATVGSSKKASLSRSTFATSTRCIQEI